MSAFILESILKSLQLPYEKEYRFAPPRKFKFDFAVPSLRCAIEFEGGVWSKGRHTRPSGYIRDCEKYNLAALNGWRVLRYTSGTAGKLLDDLKLLNLRP